MAQSIGATLSAQMSKTLGRYTLLGKLATGGMAEVFLARLDGTGGFERRVVIKRVLPQYASHPEFLRLFEQEARFASFLSHPHIATVSDFGVDPDGAAFLVMEHVEGASLRALLRAAAERDESPDARVISRIFSQVAEGLAAVHSAVDPTTGRPLDLVHRDVSPENVLLSRQGAVKLADFGIARAMSEVSTTSPDVVRGKLRYLAPEQVLGQSLSPAIDVWSLGVSLYEALTLRRPFPEENEGQTINAIMRGEYPPLESLRKDLPQPLIDVVARCLKLEPSARYPDCQDLALDLERIATEGSVSITTSVVGNWVQRLAPALELKPLPVAQPDEPLRPADKATLFDFSAAAPPAPPPAVFAPPAEPEPELELDRPAVPVEPLPEPIPAPPVRSRWPLVVGAVFVALLAVVGLAWKKGALGASTQRQVLVTSTPPGATVKLGETVLGKTPWAGDLPLTLVELEVSAPGYRPEKRQLAPGELAPLEVVLKKR